MFQFSFFLSWLYLLWRVVMPLPWCVPWRIALALVLLGVSQWYLIQRLVWGTMFSPEMPRWAVIAMGAAFVAFVIAVVLVAAFDLVQIVLWLLRRRALAPTWRRRLHGALATTAVAAASLGAFNALQVPEVRRIELHVAGLPTALDGFKLVQLTDLHLSRMLHAPWAAAVVARTNALAPDAVVVTGDLIDGVPAARMADVAPLARLSARHGVFASRGNHEYYFGARAWDARFAELGLRVLDNAHAVVVHDGAPLVIAAIGDPVAERFGQPAPDAQRALAGAPAQAPRVLMAHRPAGAQAHAGAGVDLMLSGHTHGGLIAGPLQWLVRRANDGFVSGLYAVGAMHLYVSNGTGLWNGFPARLGVPSEITLFVLRPATA